MAEGGFVENDVKIIRYLDKRKSIINRAFQYGHLTFNLTFLLLALNHKRGHRVIKY